MARASVQTVTVPDPVYPRYEVTVAEGGSNALQDVSSILCYAVADSEATELTYAQFKGEARAGSLVKRGRGTLTFGEAIPDFTGPVHVMEGVAIGTCSNCFGKINYTHSSPSADEKVWVRDGATLVMDDTRKSTYQEWQSLHFTGDGAPGMGGAFVARTSSGSTTYWPLGVNSRVYGSSVRLFVDAAASVGVQYGCRVYTNPDVNTKANNFSLNGVDAVLYGRSADSSTFVLSAAGIYDISRLVVSNITLRFSGNSSNVQPVNKDTSEIRFNGGSRLMFAKSDNLNRNETLNHTFSLVIDDLEYARFEQTTAGRCGCDPWGGTTNLWWRGPVTLNGDFRLNNTSRSSSKPALRYQGFTWSGKVSGTGGIRPWTGTSGVQMFVNLVGTENDFTGGIYLTGNSTLAVWRNGAVPAQTGAGLVSLTNSTVKFGLPPDRTQWDTFTMPETEFVGSGTVTNGTGRWAKLVKKQAGTLDYNSQMGGDELALQGGVVKFNTQYRENYTEANSPEGYEAALPAFTTLSGAAGMLDLENAGGAYTVTNLAGTPAVTNGNLTVTGTWTLDTATFGQGAVRVYGTLAFGSNAAIAFAGNLAEAAHPGQAGYLVAKADSVTGLPILHGNWHIREENGDVRVYYEKGTLFLVR